MVANVSTGEAEPEDRKFEVILGYAGSLRPTWPRETLSQVERRPGGKRRRNDSVRKILAVQTERSGPQYSCKKNKEFLKVSACCWPAGDHGTVEAEKEESLLFPDQ